MGIIVYPPRKYFSWLDFFIWTPTYWTYSLIFPIFFSTRFISGSASYLGLFLGLSSVFVGQISTLVYYNMYNEKPVNENQLKLVLSHFSQIEGFLVLGGYLSIYWLSGAMPSTYYLYDGGIHWNHVMYQLLIQDFLQYGMHRIEHAIPWLYKRSHIYHHKHINPTIYDAFDGSIIDTTCMILIPLWLTSRIIRTNVWSYMVFGTIYANMLTLIHSEFEHPWEMYFRTAGIGTQHDHRIHHQKFKHNYGHLFMYWDRIFDTNMIE